MIVKGNRCNYTYVPTSEEYMTALGAYGSSVLVIGGLITVGLYILFFEQVFFTHTNAHRVFRRHIFWIASVYPLMSLMSVISLIVPRANNICTAVKVTYMSVGISHFTDLTQLMFGGEELMLAKTEGQPLNLRVLPACCCCVCLPSNPVSKVSLRLVILLADQLPFTQALYYFLVLVLLSANNITLGSVEPTDASFYLSLFNLASFLSGVYALNILSYFSKGHLEQYSYNAKSFSMKTLVLITNMQGLAFDIMGNYNVFPCIPPYLPPQVYKQTAENSLYLLEMMVLGSYTFWHYHNQQFLRRPSRRFLGSSANQDSSRRGRDSRRERGSRSSTSTQSTTVDSVVDEEMGISSGGRSRSSGSNRGGSTGDGGGSRSSGYSGRSGSGGSTNSCKSSGDGSSGRDGSRNQETNNLPSRIVDYENSRLELYNRDMDRIKTIHTNNSMPRSNDFTDLGNVHSRTESSNRSVNPCHTSSLSNIHSNQKKMMEYEKDSIAESVEGDNAVGRRESDSTKRKGDAYDTTIGKKESGKAIGKRVGDNTIGKREGSNAAGNRSEADVTRRERREDDRTARRVEVQKAKNRWTDDRAGGFNAAGINSASDFYATRTDRGEDSNATRSETAANANSNHKRKDEIEVSSSAPAISSAIRPPRNSQNEDVAGPAGYVQGRLQTQVDHPGNSYRPQVTHTDAADRQKMDQNKCFNRHATSRMEEFDKHKVDQTEAFDRQKKDQKEGFDRQKMDQIDSFDRHKNNQMEGSLKPQMDQYSDFHTPQAEQYRGSYGPQNDHYVGSYRPQVDQYIGTFRPEVDQYISSSRPQVESKKGDHKPNVLKPPKSLDTEALKYDHVIQQENVESVNYLIPPPEGVLTRCELESGEKPSFIIHHREEGGGGMVGLGASHEKMSSAKVHQKRRKHTQSSYPLTDELTDYIYHSSGSYH